MHITARQPATPKPSEVEEELRTIPRFLAWVLLSTKIQQVGGNGDLDGEGMDNKFRLFLS